MKKICFEVPGKPQGKGRVIPLRHNFGKARVPDKTILYENWIRICYPCGMSVIEGAVVMDVVAYFQIPKSWLKKKRLQAKNGVIYPTVKPDADNILKVLKDALNGVAYDDDKQVVDVRCRKRYTTGKPRLVVEIEEIE